MHSELALEINDHREDLLLGYDSPILHLYEVCFGKRSPIYSSMITDRNPKFMHKYGIFYTSFGLSDVQRSARLGSLHVGVLRQPVHNNSLGFYFPTTTDGDETRSRSKDDISNYEEIKK